LFEVHFFDLSENKRSLASIRAAKLERENSTLSHPLSLCVVLCVLSVVVVVYVGDHQREGYDQSERRDPERESKREREFCVQFSLIGKRHIGSFAALLWSRTGKRGEN